MMLSTKWKSVKYGPGRRFPEGDEIKVKVIDVDQQGKIDMHSNHALRINITEFGEGFVHYIFFIYLVELVYKRKTPECKSG